MLKWLSEFFKASTAQTQPLTTANMNANNDIYEAVKNHLEMNTNGALLVKGNWGSGKTYHLKNVVFPKLESETDYIPIMVSLYGVSDKNSIANKVFFAYLDKVGENDTLSTASITKGAYNILESFTWLKKYVDVNKLFSGSGEDLFRFLPQKKLLICFDDLERISQKINPEDFLGMVNDLVENKGHKVLIIANEAIIENGIRFKEKTIEKTVHFSNDLSSIFDNIIASCTDQDYAAYLQDNKEFILTTLKLPNAESDAEKEFITSMENIRTLKFAIEHFRITFNILKGEKNISDKVVNSQLSNLWLFTLSISVEFKKEKSITYTDKRKLDDYSGGILSPDELGEFIWGNNVEETPSQGDEWSYVRNFDKLYFTRLSQDYIYHSQIYNQITAGKIIDKDVLIAELDAGFKVEDGNIKPAYETLSTFMHSRYFNLSEEEFGAELEKLLSACEIGAFDNLLSYLNAGVYLLGFHEVINRTQDEIKAKLKSGLIATLQTVTGKANIDRELEMTGGNYENEILQELIAFIKDELKVTLAADHGAENMRKQDLFINNLPELRDELRPENPDVRTPDALLFDSFTHDAIDSALTNWQPKDLNALAELLQFRYLDPSFADRLTSEIPFLSQLVKKIENQDFTDKLLLAHVYKVRLKPTLEKSILKLTKYKQTIDGMVTPTISIPDEDEAKD
ncbi:MAG TPA: hypothetical protein VK541_05360 [Pedobacter sp.]|uniref:hypothetical protein n=1 Tax=Pedobacter sp. TaxID=1411316 RepID=UPI002D055F6D|nr:hypothetical protein [Pedobacter sp.]HMI01887.1 hypothetical protein [Pedobacter sp.]